MKCLTLLACLVLAIAANSDIVREIHRHVIAVDLNGVPLDDIYRCPSCDHWSVSHDPEHTDEPRCARCGHVWKLKPSASSRMFDAFYQPLLLVVESRCRD